MLSRDERNVEGPVEAKVVEEVFVRTARIMRLQVGGRQIRTTAEHPFYVQGKGWLLAQELAVGNLLGSHDNRWVAVEELYDTGEWETVYNLRVADYHTYFVGGLDWGFDVWAHNAYCPQQVSGYWIGSYTPLLKMSNKPADHQVHHIGQDAVMSTIVTGPGDLTYSYGGAPAILLEGGSGSSGSPHDKASKMQIQLNGKLGRGSQITIGQEASVAQQALLAADVPIRAISAAMSLFWEYVAEMGGNASTLVTLPISG